MPGGLRRVSHKLAHFAAGGGRGLFRRIRTRISSISSAALGAPGVEPAADFLLLPGNSIMFEAK
jgi:hypothetical protein